MICFDVCSSAVRLLPLFTLMICLDVLIYNVAILLNVLTSASFTCGYSNQELTNLLWQMVIALTFPLHG